MGVSSKPGAFLTVMWCLLGPVAAGAEAKETTRPKPPPLVACHRGDRSRLRVVEQRVTAGREHALLSRGEVYVWDTESRCFDRRPGTAMVEIALSSTGKVFGLDRRQRIWEGSVAGWQVIDNAGNVTAIRCAGVDLYCLDTEGRIWQRTPGSGEDDQGWTVRKSLLVECEEGHNTVRRRRELIRQFARWVTRSHVPKVKPRARK